MSSDDPSRQLHYIGEDDDADDDSHPRHAGQSAGGAASTASTANRTICYDPLDHTAAENTYGVPYTLRIMILPAEGNSARKGRADGGSGGASGAGGRQSGAGHDIGAHLPHPMSPRQSDTAALVRGETVNGVLVRLPHPRHGKPSLFLCRQPNAVTEAGIAAVALTDVLWEVQSHGSPSGYSQAWFLPGEAVLPSHASVPLLLTPFDLTFMAVPALLQHPQAREKFLTAADLYSAPRGDDSRRRASNGEDGGEEMARNPDECPFIHVGETTAQAPGTPLLAAECWPGWPAAAVRNEQIFGPCWLLLQSHRLLEPLCEVKNVGGTSYYRFSLEKTAQWVKRKTDKLRGSRALRRIVGIADDNADDDGDTHPVRVPSTTERSSHRPTTHSALIGGQQQQAVPCQLAFSVVAEYLPDAITAVAAVACGITFATGSSPREGMHDDTTTQSTGTSRSAVTTPVSAKKAVVASPKSASVKRLEKAGRPKGTPTLMAMFAKKQAEGATGKTASSAIPKE